MNAGPVAYYVTAHGYGHAARSCDIIAALQERHPEMPIQLVSDLDPAFFVSRLGPGPPPQRAGALDAGMVQLDAVRLDVDASLDAACEVLDQWEMLVAEEVRYLRATRTRLVVADIPGIPLQAAVKAGVPAVAVGNFGWDWIYAGYASVDPRWNDVAGAFAAAYRETDLLLRLPFAEPMAAFPCRRDLPVLASPGRARRDDLAASTGADPGRRWVLLCFSGLDWSAEALSRVEHLAAYEFFTVRPLAFSRRNIHPVSRDDLPFADVLASCDSVITKPGFGILSECAANRKPIIYVDRGDFREYDVLVEAMGRYLRHVHLASCDLYAGILAPALEAIEDAPEAPENAQLGGAAMAADELYGMWVGSGV